MSKEKSGENKRILFSSPREVRRKGGEIHHIRTVATILASTRPQFAHLSMNPRLITSPSIHSFQAITRKRWFPHSSHRQIIPVCQGSGIPCARRFARSRHHIRHPPSCKICNYSAAYSACQRFPEGLQTAGGYIYALSTCRCRISSPLFRGVYNSCRHSRSPQLLRALLADAFREGLPSRRERICILLPEGQGERVMLPAP